ncbi:hypothetical protein A9X05_23935 [Mycobacterium sp. E3298]|nr:hypothetical protein A5704_18525 [Mycobacterium sp. E735]OBG61533.1 hypothetical protein A5703_22735 [Mycobacterium sp. E188]OBG77061.1 hypothetical protein A9X05_23935 [Mycobacterium sp. E3298]OBH37029.1 hypothetical protein A5691_03235 [Mycobacterium sp. E183]
MLNNAGIMTPPQRQEARGGFELQFGDSHTCASFMVDGLGLAQVDEIGIDKVMWSSDYPHNESTYGYSERSLAAVVDAVGTENTVRVASANIRTFSDL